MWDAAIRDVIVEQLAEASMRTICSREGMPDRRTVERWMGEDAEFAAKCARARSNQADYIFEGLESLEDQVISGELDVQAAKVVIASRQWRAEKLKPKVYGARTTLAGDPDAPLVIQKITREIVKPE